MKSQIRIQKSIAGRRASQIVVMETKTYLSPIRGRQVLVLFADAQPDQGDLHLGLTMNPDGGEIGLYFQGEGEGKEGEEGCTVYDVVFYSSQNPGESYGRTSNGAEQWGSMTMPTPGS